MKKPQATGGGRGFFGFRVGGTCDGEGTHHEGIVRSDCVPTATLGVFPSRPVVAPLLPRFTVLLAARFARRLFGGTESVGSPAFWPGFLFERRLKPEISFAALPDNRGASASVGALFALCYAGRTLLAPFKKDGPVRQKR